MSLILVMTNDCSRDLEESNMFCSM